MSSKRSVFAKLFASAFGHMAKKCEEEVPKTRKESHQNFNFLNKKIKNAINIYKKNVAKVPKAHFFSDTCLILTLEVVELR